MPIINGTADDDTLNGTAEDDTINGAGGNDTLSGDEGNDTLDGSDGNDVLRGDAGGDSLAGGADRDILDGGAGDDVLDGGDGNDTIYGEAGLDTLRGGGGNDWFSVYSPSELPAGESYDGGSGIDTLELSSGNFDLTTMGLISIENVWAGPDANLSISAGQLGEYGYIQAGTLTLGTAGSATIGAGASINVFYGINLNAGGNTIDLSTALFAGIVNGGASADTIIAAPSVVAAGTNSVQLNGNGGDDTLTSGVYNDTLDGGIGNDTLSGGGGDDQLTGGAGLDVLHGGTGADQFYVLAANELVAGETYDGGAENDILSLYYAGDKDISSIAMTSIEGIDAGYGGTVSLTVAQLNGLYTANVGALTLTTSGSVTLPAGFSFYASTINLNALGNTIDLSAAYWSGTLNGGASADTVFAGVGNLVFGHGGNDVLTGSEQNDTLDGGDGNDTLNGSGGSDMLTGGAGADVLDGGAGYDGMTGGAGDDLYYADDGETVTEAADEGMDEVRTDEGNYALGANVEKLTGTSVTGQGLFGNTLANIIVAGAANDWIDGGEGADAMTGGAGNDLYTVDNAGDLVIEAAGGGTDTVSSSVTHLLAAHVENLELTGTAAINGTGNALANSLTGNEGANVLNGGAGNDTMSGGLGNDTYHVDAAGDVAQEAVAWGGTDTVYASTTYTLGAGSHVEVLSTVSHAATTAINLTGNELAQTLVGNAGANVLGGGGSADTLVGLGGNDTYQIADALVRINEAAGGGTDAAYASVSYTLNGGAHVETLRTNNDAAGTAIDLTGNELAQTLIGNAGANVLNGRGGADILNGLAGIDTASYRHAGAAVTLNLATGVHAGEAAGDTFVSIERFELSGLADIFFGGAGNDRVSGLGGNDTYYVNHVGDLALEAAGEGTDTVYSSVNYTLNSGSHVEVLSTVSHAATTAINLSGNALVQTLVGNAGANVLNGRGGADTLVGLGGNDTYYIEDAAVRITEGAGGGTDAAYASVSYTLNSGAQVELLSTSSHAATTAIDLTGNQLANTIYGNAGANVLDGKGGIDDLVGLGGADTFAFSSALGAGNIDRIHAYSVADDTIALDDAVFTGLGLGALDANAFYTGSAAADAGDRIIYNSATGQLLFDADGNGAGAAVQFASVGAGLGLTANDFVVI
jgi:Ca2+-binding RTX toxin-like protein